MLINCVEDYGESILALFGVEYLINFLFQVDQISKEKGEQIIEHFVVSTELDRVAKSYKGADQIGYIWSELGDKEYAVDLLCEELANFSYYQENYRVYLLDFLHKSMKNEPADQQVSLNKMT